MIVWFVAGAVVLVLGGAAVVATGAAGSLAPSDSPAEWTPPEGPLTATDLKAARFGTALRGYRPDEVDALLDRLAAEWETRATTEPRL